MLRTTKMIRFYVGVPKKGLKTFENKLKEMGITYVSRHVFETTYKDIHVIRYFFEFREWTYIMEQLTEYLEKDYPYFASIKY